MAGRAEQEPERRCLVSGGTGPKEGLIRFVVGPDGVVPDIEERLPGRGMWLSARRDVVNTACAKRSFAKAARAPVKVPADLADRIERLLTQRCLDLLGLARRAGQVVAGYEKVRDHLRSGKTGLLLEAADGAENARGKVLGLATQVPVTAVLNAAELGAALGRDHAVHVAMSAGRLAELVCRETTRLAGFRLPPDADADPRLSFGRKSGVRNERRPGNAAGTADNDESEPALGRPVGFQVESVDLR